MSSASQKQTLWDIALQERTKLEKGELSNVAAESHLFICGSSNSGKSLLIQNFLERDETIKPTVALDFCYGRKSKQNNMTAVKDVAHIWELGGGASMAKLTEIVVTTSNIKNISVVLMLDLSKPEYLWDTQYTLLTQIKQKINQVVTELSKTQPNIENELKEKALERIGVNHVDKHMINPLLIPLVIIGGKFDVYQEFNTEKKQMISKAIRYLAHTNGAMVQFFSTKAEGLSGRAKGLLNHLAFNTALSKTSSLDHSKPVIAPFGHDTLEQIGAPPVPSDYLMHNRGSSPDDLWKDSFNSVFPQQKEVKNEKNNPVTDEKFADALVDNIRAQKDQELDWYRKVSERKAKEAQLNASVGKKSSKSENR